MRTDWMERMSTVKLRSCAKVKLHWPAPKASLIILTGNRLCWSVGSGCGCYSTHCYCCRCCCYCCCCCWERNCITEKEIIWFAFYGQQVWGDLHSVCFSWLYSIQCHIGPVDCYWRLVWTYIVCDQVVDQCTAYLLNQLHMYKQTANNWHLFQVLEYLPLKWCTVVLNNISN